MDGLIAELQVLLARTPGAEVFTRAFSSAVRAVRDSAGASTRAIAFLEATDWPSNATQDTRAVAKLVQDEESLHWAVPYGDDPRSGRGFAERAAFCTIAGPGEALDTAVLAAGFFVVGPDVDYNDHRHGPAELYLPVSGTARYWTEPSGWQSSAPGSAIVHPPWTWHAMGTDDQAVLIFWMWLLPDGVFGPMPELSDRFGGAPVAGRIGNR